MAIVKFKFKDNLEKSVKYVTRQRGDDGLVSSIDCSAENATDEFRSVKRFHNKEGGNQVLHLIQSWSPGESDKQSLEEFHDLGRQFAEKAFPGHQAVISTHNDKGHVHNHIAINTIAAETGDRISNERIWEKTQEKFVKRLHRINDEVCMDAGLA
mgnify:CR=1 FL=1